jgi:hypothetical protein
MKKASCHSRKTLKNPLFAQKIHRKRLLLTILKKGKKNPDKFFEYLDLCAVYRTMPSSDLSISTSKRKVHTS